MADFINDLLKQKEIPKNPILNILSSLTCCSNILNISISLPIPSSCPRLLLQMLLVTSSDPFYQAHVPSSQLLEGLAASDPHLLLGRGM